MKHRKWLFFVNVSKNLLTYWTQKKKSRFILFILLALISYLQFVHIIPLIRFRFSTKLIIPNWVIFFRVIHPRNFTSAINYSKMIIINLQLQNQKCVKKYLFSIEEELLIVRSIIEIDCAIRILVFLSLILLKTKPLTNHKGIKKLFLQT